MTPLNHHRQAMELIDQLLDIAPFLFPEGSISQDVFEMNLQRLYKQVGGELNRREHTNMDLWKGHSNGNVG